MWTNGISKSKTGSIKQIMQNFFFIRAAHRYQKIQLGDILYIEACKNYVSVVTEKKSYMVLVSLKQLERMLPSEQFCRVHRSYIVSLDRADGFDQESVFLNQVMIPVGEQYREKLKNSVQILVSETRSAIKLSSCTAESLLEPE